MPATATRVYPTGWIAPDGTWYGVADLGHEDWALARIQATEPTTYVTNASDALEERGWVHVSRCMGRLKVYARDCATPAQLGAIADLAATHRSTGVVGQTWADQIAAWLRYQ